MTSSTAALIDRVLHLEGLGEFDVQDLLAPPVEGWDVATAFSMDINSARQIAVIATDPQSGQTGAALLDPIQVCQEDLGFGGPGTAQLIACGGDLSAGTTADLTLFGVPAFAPVFLLVGLDDNPIPFKGGTLVPVPVLLVVGLVAGPAGTLVMEIPGGGGPASVFVQAVRPDAQQVAGYALSNALKLDVLP